MNSTFLLLGGNLGHIQENFSQAINLISNKIGSISQQSRLYQSEPWGFEAKELFLNQVIKINTKLSAIEVLRKTQAIEQEIGRKEKTKEQNYSSRLIDIDILFFNNEIIETKELIIPHPRLHLRNFTLFPLNEIIPNFTHPSIGKTILWLTEHSKDKSNITIYEET